MASTLTTWLYLASASLSVVTSMNIPAYDNVLSEVLNNIPSENCDMLSVSSRPIHGKTFMLMCTIEYHNNINQ